MMVRLRARVYGLFGLLAVAAMVLGACPAA